MSHWSTKPCTSFVSVPIRYEDVHILCVSANSEDVHILCVSADSIYEAVHILCVSANSEAEHVLRVSADSIEIGLDKLCSSKKNIRHILNYSLIMIYQALSTRSPLWRGRP